MVGNEGSWVLLVKFYDKMKYAEDFLGGRLYCNRVRYFRELEEAGRGDPDEGGVLWEGAEMEVRADDGEWHKIEGMVGPPRLNYPHLDALNLFCMTAFIVAPPVTGPELISQIKNAVAESLRECRKMGRHAVLVRDCMEFMRRAEAAASLQGFQFWRGEVQYYHTYPRDHFTWGRDSVRPVFWKASRFEKQREHRLVLKHPYRRW